MVEEVTLGLTIVAIYGLFLGVTEYEGWLVLSHRTRKYWESRGIEESFTFLLQFILLITYVLAILFTLTVLFKFFGAETLMWLRLSEHQSPILKWKPGRVDDAGLSTAACVLVG